MELLGEKKFEKLLGAKSSVKLLHAWSYGISISCAFISKGRAEFGNKDLYSMFAVTGDAVHLQSPALICACQVQTWTCEKVSNVSYYLPVQCKYPAQNHLLCRTQKYWCIFKFLFWICIPFFKTQSRNICTLRTFLQVLINRTSKSTQLFCQWQTGFPNFLFCCSCVFLFFCFFV